MKIVIAVVGATTTGWLAQGIDHYVKRAGRYAPVEMAVVPDVKQRLKPEAQREREGKGLLALLQPGDCLTLLDERGRELTSLQLADELQRRMSAGLKRLVLAIGGPYGFSKEVYARADAMLALSKLTLTHEMARLLLAEQVYRGLSILHGDPYHHE